MNRVAGAWMAFIANTDDAEIVKAFLARHGRAPERIVEKGPIKLAGPIVGTVDVAVGEHVVVAEVEGD
jgi:hypothetical protein